jgi:triosephosphate isomerase
MVDQFEIKLPFFEIGPKVYLYGKQAVDLAVFADSLAEKYDVDIIFSAQYTDIAPISGKVRRLHVFAQHMDAVKAGCGIGAVLPEALKDAGARGVLLNHAERPLSLSALHRTIVRADETGLATMVCGGDLAECMAAACLSPNIILAEAPELIGTGRGASGDVRAIGKINQGVSSINTAIKVLHGAGIRDEKDVYEVISAGADATGSTSGILNAIEPFVMVENMIRMVREAWDKRNAKEAIT